MADKYILSGLLGSFLFAFPTLSWAQPHTFTATAKVFIAEHQTEHDAKVLAQLESLRKVLEQASETVKPLVVYRDHAHLLAVTALLVQSPVLNTQKIQGYLAGISVSATLRLPASSEIAKQTFPPEKWQRQKQFLRRNHELEEAYRQYRQQLLDLADEQAVQKLKKSTGKKLEASIQATEHLQQGHQATDNQQYSSALEHYTQALNLSPQDATILTSRGNLYTQLGQYEPALNDLNQALGSASQDGFIYSSRGLVYMRLGQFDQVLSDYGKAIQLEPQYEHNYSHRGIAAFARDNYPLALADFQQVVKHSPQDAQAYNSLGFVYFTMGQHSKALDAFDAAIQINPQFTYAYNNRGNAHLNLGHLQKALQDYNQAIRLTPTYALTYNNRAFAYKKMKKCVESIQDYKKSCQLGYSAACNAKCP